jgi:hypothetical protein
MLSDRNKNLTTFADKMLVRDYVQKRIGADYLTELLWFGTNLEEFSEIQKLRNFVVKPNHGSHALVLVSEAVSNGKRLPRHHSFSRWTQHRLNPDCLDYSKLTDLTKYWLTLNYYHEANKFPEWAYKNISPLILVEELLKGKSKLTPEEFRFFMFSGKCELVYRFSERFEDECITIYDPSGNIINGEILGFKSTDEGESGSLDFSEMLKLAEILSEGCDFIRVDFFETSQGIKFSELTNYPLAASEKFKPQTLNKRLGANWIPKY